MITTQTELEQAFYAVYPQHDPKEITVASSIDWADWFKGMEQSGRIHPDLVED